MVKFENLSGSLMVSESSIDRDDERGTGKLSDLPKVTQPEMSQPGFLQSSEGREPLCPSESGWGTLEELLCLGDPVTICLCGDRRAS